MQEALIGFVVLVIGLVVGSALKPIEAEAQPLYPVASAGGGHEDHHDPHH
ncbi:MAG TPA: hypothetical protein VGK48_13770 [Terriglobia bacterium]|jgi:hypothetical protein